MADFHCDTFEVRIRFEPQEINAEAFLKAVSQQGIEATPDEDGDTLVYVTFGSAKETNGDYHAHLTVTLWKDGSGRADLNYYPSNEKGIDSVDVGNCARWFGEFLTDKLTMHVHANYTFDKSFAAVIGLPFPLVTSERALAGSVVAGLALMLPNGTTAIIHNDAEESETHVFLRETSQTDLRGFNLFGELERLSPTVDKLVKRVENGASEKKTEN